jgi:hypothetical protein
LIIAGSEDSEFDFYQIPFSDVEEFFVDSTMSSDKEKRNRWVANILPPHRLRIWNAGEKDAEAYYGNQKYPDFRASLLQQLKEEIESDLSGSTEHPRRTQKVIDRGSKPLSWYRETYIRDRYKCVYCDKDVKSQFDDWMSIQVDHIIPVSKGGSHDLGNRGTSCNVCNSLKHTYVPENFESMSREELLADIRKYIRGKREVWGARYQEALEEYKKR